MLTLTDNEQVSLLNQTNNPLLAAGYQYDKFYLFAASRGGFNPLQINKTLEIRWFHV